MSHETKIAQSGNSRQEDLDRNSNPFNVECSLSITIHCSLFTLVTLVCFHSLTCLAPFSLISPFYLTSFPHYLAFIPMCCAGSVAGHPSSCYLPLPYISH